MKLFSFRDTAAPTNLGDTLGPMILRQLGATAPITHNLDASPKILSVGSVIQMAYRPGDTIWGSGIIHRDHRVAVTDHVLAVRGPLTYGRLAGAPRGIVYGDPALLCPLFWPSSSKQPRRYLGWLPHWVDAGHPPWPTPPLDISFTLDITAPLVRLIDNLAQCHTVITSSLHGLVLAEAYRVPTVLWVDSPTERVTGGRFKFADYLAGTDRDTDPGLVPRLSAKDLTAIQNRLLRTAPCC